MVLTDTHELYGWGNNITGAIADAGRYKPFASRIDLDGKMYVWGLFQYEYRLPGDGNNLGGAGCEQARLYTQSSI